MQHQMETELKPKIQLIPLAPEGIGLYCKLGEQAYRDHYLHLWPDRDPSPYIDTSFTREIVTQELGDPNNLHFLMRAGKEYIGIAKVIKNQKPPELELPKPLFLEKIYLLGAFTGQGFGEDTLLSLHELAREMGRQSVYLLTMRKGRALAFYHRMGYKVLREAHLPFENAVQEERGMYLLGKIFN